jgi:hypothetical protein
MNPVKPVFSVGKQLSTYRAILAKVKQIANCADNLQNVEPTLVQVRKESKPAPAAILFAHTASYCESLSVNSDAEKIQFG